MCVAGVDEEDVDDGGDGDGESGESGESGSVVGVVVMANQGSSSRVVRLDRSRETLEKRYLFMDLMKLKIKNQGYGYRG